ncbi:hypothetical protein EV424DRAFT_576397 [Suillus variegatus]|nr:hypothetical protein EV424DRAFT_576397 [Suillus variegatus]
MHQALLVPEVLLEIFAYVNTIPSATWETREIFGHRIPSTQRTSTLAALARTCKFFHEPAMDLLWTEIHGLEPLLGCVARLHPLIYRMGTRRVDFFFSWAEGVEPLSAHEARQFLRHSSRIRTLNIERTHFQLISVIPANVYVFPKLRSLNLSTPFLNLFLPLTLHPRLLNLDKDRRIFVTHCSALEHLYIHTDDCYDIASRLSLLSDRIRRCTRLVTLSCPMLNWETWKHLSCLPTLLELEIDQGYDDAPSLSKRDVVNLSFLNITSLSFRKLADAAEIITVIQHSQFPSLKKFKFAALYLYSEEAEQLFHALSCCKACQTLEEITICSPDEGDLVPPDSEPVTPVPHWLCFTQLRTLQLWFYNPCIYLDNDILLQAMSSWPHIRTLEINYLDDLDDHHASSEVSLHGLFTALSLCPQLHTLRILINLATIDVDPHAEPIQHTSLQTLELLDTSQSQIADAEALARIISAWLPCVDKVESIGSTWDEVNKHLKSSTAATALYVAGTS